MLCWRRNRDTETFLERGFDRVKYGMSELRVPDVMRYDEDGTK